MLRAGVALAVIASQTLPVAVVAGPATVDVRMAQARDFSHIEFRASGRGQAVVRRNGQAIILQFGKESAVDLAQLRHAPPRWLKAAESSQQGGRLAVTLTLTDDADAKIGEADGATYINLFARPKIDPTVPVAASTALAAPMPTARPNPTPARGVVRVRSEVTGSEARLQFDWAAAAAAAVFRRGDAVWIVFDADATLDIAKVPRWIPQFSNPTQFRGPGWTAVRLFVPKGTMIAAIGEGSSWIVTFGPGSSASAEPIKLARDEDGGLTANLAGATRAIWIDDPLVGDRFAAVTALGPAKAFRSHRQLVNLVLEPSVQGLVVAARAPDVSVTTDGDLVHVNSAKGLNLSPRSAESRRQLTQVSGPKPASLPGLIGDDWARVDDAGSFLRKYSSLLEAVSEEVVAGRNGSAQASLALARFLVGSELNFEAIGVLNDAVRRHQELSGDAEFRGLRGMARAMAGRFKEAESDFSVSILADDPSAALWRGYIAAHSGAYADAHQKFVSGGAALRMMPAVWRSRFQRADAESALASGDASAAADRIALALTEPVPEPDQLASRLVQARVVEAQGRLPQALALYQALSRAPLESVAAPALLYATRIQFQTGHTKAEDTAKIYNSIRYRWRGDATELETIRALGQLYLSQGHFRESLETLRSAGQRLPDLPQALKLQAELTGTFRALFLDGQADGLQPIQSLALFYDFKELTPIGADGDLMVRKLVRRLVDVDLLEQAADLLKYQVDNRLDGLAKAQVATDLATIYLMDRRPEEALGAINASRSTALPGPLTLQRRLLQARAFAALGRLDAAAELLETDKSPEGQLLRADLAWKARDWPQAGRLYEARLGDKSRHFDNLSADDEAALLRAGVSYSLAGDGVSLTRLRARFESYFEKARNPEALRVAYSGTGDSGLPPSGLTHAVSADQTFEVWVTRMKQRFRESAALGPGSGRPAKG